MLQPRRELARAERLDWVRLIRSQNVGPITFYQLIGHYGSAAAALAALPDLARRGGSRGRLKIFSRAAAEREVAEAEAKGVRLIARIEPAYPDALAAIEDAPPVLAVIGRPALAARPCIAVVGARNASASGLKLTRKLASGLSDAGLVVVSGMARGIDSAAHEGALKGGTIAVLGGGVDVVYPANNKDLYKSIAEQGLLVAEPPVGTQPQARHFPRRNRLISGLSLGVLVVEAAPRSGSLITARLALEQGREVFAIPGSPLDPRSRGTNKLIREGALLVERADDIVDALEPMLRTPLTEPDEREFAASPLSLAGDEDLAPARQAIVDLLGAAPLQIDDLIRESGLSPQIVITVVLELELAGRVDRHPGNRISRRFEDGGDTDLLDICDSETM